MKTPPALSSVEISLAHLLANSSFSKLFNTSSTYMFSCRTALAYFPLPIVAVFFRATAAIVPADQSPKDGDADTYVSGVLV